MSCDRVGCNKDGNKMAWVEDRYAVWLCERCYDEYWKNHYQTAKEELN